MAFTLDEIFFLFLLCVVLAYMVAVIHPLLILSALISWAAL